MRPWLFLGFVCFLWFGGVAHAGHYRLPVAQFIEGEEALALKRAGINDTLHLLERTQTAKDRRDLAQRTRLRPARIRVLAQQCELLRLEGVGPTAVRLLGAAQVNTLAELGAAEASSLHQRILNANAQKRISEGNPSVEMLSDWIRAARGLKPLVN